MRAGKLMQPLEQSLLGYVLSFRGDYNLWKPIFALLITGPEPGRKFLSVQHLFLKKNDMLVTLG